MLSRKVFLIIVRTLIGTGGTYEYALLELDDLYEYSSSYSYGKDDLVTYMNSIYKSISDDNLGEEPINSPFWIRIL